jgi:hypothetical protein
MCASRNGCSEKSQGKNSIRQIARKKTILTDRGYIHACAQELPAMPYHAMPNIPMFMFPSFSSAKHSSPPHNALEIFHTNTTQPTTRSLPDHILQNILRDILTQLFRNPSQIIDTDFPLLPLRKKLISLLNLLTLRLRIVVSCM